VGDRYEAYVITCAVSSKRYIGITTCGLARRWAEHRRSARRGIATALYAAITKYGDDAFTITPIACAIDRDALKDLERLLIAQENTLAPHGYNLTRGGDGVDGLPAEIIARTAQKNIGRKHSNEARERIGAASRGHPVSLDVRQAISLARKGKPLSAEHRQKLSTAKLGKALPARSEEHCLRIAEGLRRAHERKRQAAAS